MRNLPKRSSTSCGDYLPRDEMALCIEEIAMYYCAAYPDRHKDGYLDELLTRAKEVLKDSAPNSLYTLAKMQRQGCRNSVRKVLYDPDDWTFIRALPQIRRTLEVGFVDWVGPDGIGATTDCDLVLERALATKAVDDRLRKVMESVKDYLPADYVADLTTSQK